MAGLGRCFRGRGAQRVGAHHDAFAVDLQHQQVVRRAGRRKAGRVEGLEVHRCQRGEVFDLANTEFLFKYLLQNLQLLLFIFHADDRPRMSHADNAVPDRDLNLGRQPEQTDIIRYGGPVFADFLAKVFLPDAAFFNKPLETQRHLERVEVRPLDILNNGHFQHLLVVGKPDKCRHLRKACDPRRTASSFACDQLIPVRSDLSDSNRLNNALFLNGNCKFGQLFFFKL